MTRQTYIGEDAGEAVALSGGRSPLRRFFLLSFAGGGVGLVAWCALDLIIVKFAPSRFHDFDWALAYFPLAVLAAGMRVFRDLGLAARVGLSTAAALAASVLSVLLVLTLGIQLHLSIGGNL